MKKENVLVVALVVIAIGGIYVFNILKSGPPIQKPSAITPQALAAKTDMSDIGSAQGIGWKDFTPGMAQARKENKFVFLYFHAPWCTYCNKLKMTTFKDRKVLAYLKENFISIQVNTDENKILANDWQVKGLPSMWFLEPDGGKINRMPGYMDAGKLLSILKYIQTQSYTTMEFNEFVKR